MHNRSQQYEIDTCYEALSIMHMLLSEDHNDVICMLNHLVELCFQGKRGWDPVGSTERELEENSVYSEVYVVEMSKRTGSERSPPAPCAVKEGTWRQ